VLNKVVKCEEVFAFVFSEARDILGYIFNKEVL